MRETSNSYRFFCNKECEYFPCHATNDPMHFNCLFCYCPLYSMKACGGNYRVLESGVKDCSNCLLPHYHYEYIVGKLMGRNEKLGAKAERKVH